MAEMNPYQAPQANVADRTGSEGSLAAEPRSVDAGRGLAWLTEGWELFRASPFVWIAIAAIAFVLFLVVGLLPIVGTLANALLSMLVGGGIMLGCRAIDRGDELTIGHLFAGFQSHLSPLLVVGALYLGATLALVLLFMLLGGGMLFSSFSGPDEIAGAIGATFLLMLVVAAALVPIVMAFWFAPALVALNDVAPVEAIEASFKGCLRNVLPFLVYGVILLILSVLASLPFLLGWLVLGPVLAGSIYASYKDIFLQRS